LFFDNVDYNQYGATTKIEYGNGVVTSYAYDSRTLRLDRMVTSDPSGLSLQDLTYTYDNVGNIKTIADRTARAMNQAFSYDALNRLTTALGKYCDDGSRECLKEYSYDEVGNIDKIIIIEEGMPDVVKDYTYGENAGPHAVTSITKDGAAWLAFTYDANGNMDTQTDFEKAEATAYAYDTENRLIEVRRENEPVARYVYDGDGGRVKKIVFKEKSLQRKGAGVKFSLNPQKGSKKTLSGDSRRLSESNGFGFDNWAISNEIRSFSNSTNAIGDTEILPPDPSTRTGSAHGLAQDSAQRADQMESQALPAGLHSSEGWKPGSPSRGKEEHPNAEITKYVGSLYEVRGTKQTRFIYLGGTRIAAVEADGKATYYHGNHLGSTNVTTDADGNLDELFENEPFGAITTHEKYGSDEDTARWYFTGKEFDTETGLVYFGARYYNPIIGRFITPDILVQSPGNPQTFNRYTYANNNPVNNIDSDGHGWWKKFWGQVASVFVGVAAFIVSGFNPVVGMQAYSITNSIISGVQALASGANPFRVLGSIGLGMAIGLGTADMIGGIANLGFRMAAFAAQGAVIGASGAAIMGGDVGMGAAFGAGMGATMGFLSSQQMTNLRNHGEFLSDKNFAQLNQRVSDLAQMAGVGGDANHSFDLISGKGELSSGIAAGHTGMAVDGDAFGFYPKPGQGELGWVFGKSGPGQIRAEGVDFIQQAQSSGGIFGTRVNGFQANVALMQKYNPGTFSLATNCSRFALDTSRMIGINVPSNLTTFGQINPAKVAAWSGSIRSWSADK